MVKSREALMTTELNGANLKPGLLCATMEITMTEKHIASVAEDLIARGNKKPESNLPNYMAGYHAALRDFEERLLHPERLR